MSNDDRRDWEPYGTERGDDGRAHEPQPGHGGQGQGGGPGHPGYDPQAPAGSGNGTQGLDPVAFVPGQYSYDPNAYDPNPGPNAYDPNPGPNAYDPNTYDAKAYAPNTYDANTYDANAYDPNAYDPNGYAPPAYDADGYASTGYAPGRQQTGGPVVPDPNGHAGYAPSGYQSQSGGYPDPGYGQGAGYVEPPSAYRQPPPPTGYLEAQPPPVSASIPRPSANPTQTGGGSGAGTPRPAPERPAPAPTPAPEKEKDARVPPPRARKAAAGRPGGGRQGQPGYGSDEFAFVDDESEQAEDVIDWLSFAETRSERRDERRRTIRLRLIALAAVIAVALVGVGGYVAWDTWLADDKSANQVAASSAVLIQLRAQDGRSTANAILTVDPAQKSAAMVTVSSTAVVNADNSSYALGQLMADEGPGASRDALSDLLGVHLTSSWVVTEPVLQGLVDLTGGIELNADVELKGPDGKVLVTQGRARVGGAAALAFAKYAQRGEPAAISGDRFGRVLQALLAVLPTDPASVLSLLANMANVPDPSLPDDKLSTMLGSLAEATRAQRIQVRALPMSAEGVLDLPTAVPIVRDLLGGTVREGGGAKEGPLRVMVDDASGETGAHTDARARLLNAGVTYVPGGVMGKRVQAASTVQYADDAHAEDAAQVAMTLRLPTTAVKKVQGEMLADVVVTLGEDYEYVAPTKS